NRRAFIDFGQPIDLKTYLENQPSHRPVTEMASEIRSMLIEGIDNQKRVILGPIMKSRQQLKETVLLDARVKQKIENIASAEGKPVWQLRKKAGEFFDEIAADYDIAYVQFFDKALTWFWKKIFEGIDVDTAGLATVREWARKGPLIFIPSHKSHIDYLILNHVLYNNHMHIPRIAAGKNLAFWPMGHIFRKSGAFFIRRSFKQPRLYLEVFNRYIKALVQEGHPIEFFIEGGRSRNGKLVLPKTGFLSILLKAHQEGFCKDLIFVPSSIVYDRVIEEKSLLNEIEGAAKEKESLKQVIRARRFLKRSHGKVYIRFGEPFSLNEYLSHIQTSSHELQRKLAFHLIQAINHVTLVTPLSLVATGILTKHHRGFLRTELVETVDTLLRFLKRHEFPIASSLTDPSKAVQETLSLLMNWKIMDVLEDAEGEEEPFYYVEEDKKTELEYYKNNIIHFFIPHAFVATSLLTGKEEIKDLESVVSDCAFLKNVFGSEFVFDEEEVLRTKVSLAIDYFLDTGLLSRSRTQGEGYKITKLGFDKLPIWAALAKTFLESYWIAVRSITQQKDKKAKKEDLLKHMSYLGRRYHKLGIVDHIGSLSRLNFINATGYIEKEFLKSRTGSAQEERLSRERLSRFGQRLYELSHYGQ
ncbi:MAG: 1-acyl-sn-glycerol-3-phosphate acyltransferase, partial [Desulfobacterales bacterium]|nr:1-acyl-sn-glycerol-3-phosphate acyltransferase [Desulfobacterales bacterium]